MARIKGKDIYLKNDDQIYFGDNNEAALWYENNDLLLNHTISGIDPTELGHLVTKRYLDNELATVSGGSGASSFTELTDTPSDYSSSANYVVAVNGAESGLEFVQPGSYNVDGGFANSVYGGVPSLDGGQA